MSVSKSEIEALQEWLRPRLGALITHSDKVRELLKAANGSPERVARGPARVVRAGPRLRPSSPLDAHMTRSDVDRGSREGRR